MRADKGVTDKQTRDKQTHPDPDKETVHTQMKQKTVIASLFFFLSFA